MSEKFSWDDVHVDTLPSGWFKAIWVKCNTEEATQAGRRMIRCSWRIDEPEKYAGLFHNESFVVGRADEGQGMAIDPTAFGTRRFKEACQGSGVPLRGSMDLMAISSALKDRPVMLLINQYTEPETNRDGSPNEYAGQIRARCNGFANTTERKPSVFDQPGAKGGGNGAAKSGGASVKTVPCVVCGKDIPLSEIENHVATCSGGAD